MMTAAKNLRWAFIGADGFRAGWRFLVFAGIYILSGYPVFALVGRFYDFSDTGFTPADLLVAKVADGLSLLVISLVLARLEKHRAAWFGLAFEKGIFRLFGMGSLFAAITVTLLMLIPWACGYVSFDGLTAHGVDLWKYLGLWLAAMLVAGFAEELLFRGYILSCLSRGLGFWPAALGLSVLFGVAHLNKPMENVPDILNIVLLGLLLCYSVRRTGSLWFGIGFHAAFNLFALGLYGSPNTGAGGQPLEHHILDTHVAGPAWLTGGPQGLEASWLLPLLILAMFGLLHRLYPQDRFPRE